MEITDDDTNPCGLLLWQPPLNPFGAKIDYISFNDGTDYLRVSETIPESAESIVNDCD